MNKKPKKRRRTNDGKAFEKKTKSILQKYNPEKDALANVQIQGKLSESSREVDIMLRNPDEFDFIAYECKDEKASIGTPTVESWYTKLMDLGARRGVIVSNSPFTRGAKRMASKLGIELLNIVDSKDEAIKTKLTAHTGLVKEHVSGWGVEFSEVPPIEIQERKVDLSTAMIHQSSKDITQTLKQLAQDFWEEIGDRTTSGVERKEFTNVTVETDEITFVLPSMTIVLDINFEYRIGTIDITHTDGIYNVIENSYQTNSMTLGPFGEDISNRWTKVSKDELENSKLTSILHTRTDLTQSRLA